MPPPLKTVRVADDLWRSNMMPEGQLERWRAEHGAPVEAGQPLAEIRVEDSLHEVLSPARGRFTHAAHVGDMIEPGFLLGWVEAVEAPIQA